MEKAYDASGSSVDVMAAVDTKQLPAAPFNHAREFAAGY
jgi:hypothetical protein